MPMPIGAMHLGVSGLITYIMPLDETTGHYCRLHASKFSRCSGIPAVVSAVVDFTLSSRQPPFG